MDEDVWIDVVDAAQRHNCSTRMIIRWINEGKFEMRTERLIGGEGRKVVRTWVRIADLAEVSGENARKEHVRKIRATAKPLTDEQKKVIVKVFLEHLRDREYWRSKARAGEAGSD